MVIPRINKSDHAYSFLLLVSWPFLTDLQSQDPQRSPAALAVMPNQVGQTWPKP